MKRIMVFAVLATLLAPVWASASGEAAASSTGRGKYLAGQGIIIPAQEVYIDSYIAAIDYSYPVPEGGVGVTLYAGHHQVSSGGQEELIHIGIQGGRQEFEELPPMNLAFVIDKSGSMEAEDKRGWVKDSFDIFIERVRDIDFVALVVFDNQASVTFRSTKMDSKTKRMQFKDTVRRITPGGGTNLAAGLKLGYQEVMANYREEYTNRVLFLTDGMGNAEGILEMAESYREIGVNVSTIGVGTGFDLQLMTDLGRSGGGSSRFIADREEMEKTFGSELDRMVVPAVRDLTMELDVADELAILDTWGYEHKISGGTVTYELPTLHHRDYETILTHVRIPALPAGAKELARFSVTYKDLMGRTRRQGPYSLKVEVVDMEAPVAGISDGMVLKSGTMLHFAQGLNTIGELYYSCREEIAKINEERDRLWKAKGQGEQVVYEELTSDSIQTLERSVGSKMQRAMDITVALRKELNNARLRLDNTGFDDELMILDKYIEILGGELEMEEGRVREIAADVEIAPAVQERPFGDHVDNLFREMMLDLSGKQAGTIAVSGFTSKKGGAADLLALLDEMALVNIGGFDTFRVVERARLEDVLAEQELALSDLMDTGNAIQVGKLLTANYIVTGSVIEMPGSVVIFGRIINVETGEVESAAQVIVPKDGEVQGLLSST